MQFDQLMATYCTADQLPAYIRNRLHNNTRDAPPPVASYHGVEVVEDMLFTLYHEPDFPPTLQPYFWHEVANVAREAWTTPDAEVFARVAHLCVRLGRPRNLDQWAFLPKAANQFDWSQGDSHISIYALAIWMLYSWNARKQAFWTDTFKTLLSVCIRPDGHDDFEKLKGVLRHVWVALEQPDRDQWFDLFRLAQVRGKAATEIIGQCLDGKWGACKDDQDCESQLLSEVRAAICELQSKGQLTDFKTSAEKDIRKALQQWSQLPWRIPKNEVSQAVGRITSHGKSPRAYQPRPSPYNQRMPT